MKCSESIYCLSILGQVVTQHVQCLEKGNLKKSEIWKKVSEVTSNPWSDQYEVGNASIKAFILLYGGRGDDTLAKLR